MTRAALVALLFASEIAVLGVCLSAEPLLPSPAICAVSGVVVTERQSVPPRLHRNSNDVPSTTSGYNVKQLLTHLTYFTGSRDYRTIPKAGLSAVLTKPKHLPFGQSRHYHLECVDGRVDHAILGSFGGDIAEFLLSLTSLEKTRPVSALFSQEQVNAYLRAYLTESDRRFFFHTDAMNWLMWQNATRTQLGLNHPLKPRTLEEKRKSLELSTDYVGCSHLQLLMKNDAQYRTRRELVQYVIRSVYSLLMDDNHQLRKKILFEILEGYPSSEKAFVNVLSPGPEEAQRTSDKTRPKCVYHSPLIVPRLHRSPDHMIAVYHPRAVYEFRAELASFFARMEQKDGGWKLKLFQLMNEIGNAQMKLTKQTLYPSIPTYVANFS